MSVSSRSSRKQVAQMERETQPVHPRVRSKLRLVDAAWRLFPRGVASVSLMDVAREAGFTKGGLQAHFQHKEALVDAVAVRAIESAPLAAGDLEATNWARVWMALRAESTNAPLQERLNVLDRSSVHASRVEAMETLVHESLRAMFSEKRNA